MLIQPLRQAGPTVRYFFTWGHSSLPLPTSLSPCFPSCLSSCLLRLFCVASAGFFVLPLRVRPVEGSSHLVILLHYCFGQSGTTVVPPGRGQRPIPFFLAKDFYASPLCLLFGPPGWSSLGVCGRPTFSTLRFSWFFSSAESFSVIEYSGFVVLNRKHVSAGWSSSGR